MARPLIITVPHQLGLAEARRRIDQGFDQIQSQIAGKALMSVNKSWAGDVLTFSASLAGQSVSGRLNVLRDAVEMEIHLPEILSMLAGAIKGRLQKQGQLLLGKK